MSESLVTPGHYMLTEEQQDAAHTLGAHVSVTAAPGAGKTSVLIERYLHILRTQDISIDQIVAITFTRRAANEMRERLRREVDREVDLLLNTAEPAMRARWIRHKRSLDGAVITTIHGFCSRLLREFPLEAGLDPQFSVFDEHQSALLLETVAEEILTELISAQHEAITRLVAVFNREKIIDGLTRIYNQIRNQGLTFDDVERRTRATHSTIQSYEECLSELDSVMIEFLGMANLTPAAETKRQACERAWPSFRKRISNVPTLHDLVEYCRLIESFQMHRPVSGGKQKEIVEKLDRLIWEKDPGGYLSQIYFDVLAVEYATDVIDVIRLIDERLNSEKQKMAALDYDDLQIRLLRMLADHREMAHRISNRYRYFLVDEFQDTNDLQRAIMT
ncbi:MAG: UvrD-helicase domain-containing protein, partial [Pyrinomonadaceae bacterium]